MVKREACTLQTLHLISTERTTGQRFPRIVAVPFSAPSRWCSPTSDARSTAPSGSSPARPLSTTRCAAASSRFLGSASSALTSTFTSPQVIDALLKELCSALLQSDVNVKLVAQLRTRVRAKVKKSLEEAEAAGGKEANKKNVVQKVREHALPSLGACPR